MKTILITGGAGFIGSSLVERLHHEGIKSIVLDSLSEQVHGALPRETSGTFKKISEIAEFHHGDIRDRDLVRKLILRSDAVVHLAAETGTGQSMYAISNYCDVNIQGTAILLEQILAASNQVKKVIIASSRAIYGEGKYECADHGIVFPNARTDQELKSGQFQPDCPACKKTLVAVPTTEDSPAKPLSIYGITKLAQERLIMTACHSAGIPAIALRFQNVYGPGQSLSNPYTGILSIFSNRARTDKAISIFEDGLESRDFVYIDDVVESIWLSLQSNNSSQIELNVGSGLSVSVSSVVANIVDYFNSKSEVRVTGEYRIGDIRHNIASTEKAQSAIGFKSKTSFDIGVRKFLEWAFTQTVVGDKYELSLEELRNRGLLK